jgi:hydroxymethylglutaryl-CoA reductase
VVAAVCNAARQNYETGFTTSVSGNLMIAQVQAVEVADSHAARLRILERRDEIKAICDACDPVLLGLGGGFRDVEVRILDTLGGSMVVTHLAVDTRDAMGANAVNTMAEKVAPQIAAWTRGRVYLRILSTSPTGVSRAHIRFGSSAKSAARTCATASSARTTSPLPIRTGPQPTTRGS